jgi:hypothetical protein
MPPMILLLPPLLLGGSQFNLRTKERNASRRKFVVGGNKFILFLPSFLSTCAAGTSFFIANQGSQFMKVKLH